VKEEAPFDAVEEHLKGSQTIAEIAEQVCLVEPITMSPPEFTPMAEEKVQAALKAIRQRSFSERNPHLGKMIKCQVCNRRHRAAPKRTSEKPPFQIIYVTDCEQKFTNVKNGFECFREDPEKGTLVPDLRTAVDPDFQPTIRQIMGAAAFAKKRHNRHPNMKQLQLIERTRKVFAEMGFTITEGEQAQKNMEIARKEARHQLFHEARKRRRVIHKRTKRSRRINRTV